MALISLASMSPINGVSQQAPTLRLNTQCDQQDNMIAILTDGLINRPPSEFVALLSSKTNSGSAIFAIDKGLGEQYICCITDDAIEPIEIFTIDGTKCTVRYGTLSDDDIPVYTADDNVKNYVISSNPRDNFTAVTISDHTILVNKLKVVQMSGVPDAAAIPKAIAYVKNGQPAQDYKIYVDGVREAFYTTGGSDAPETYKTTVIAENLYNQLVSSLGTTDWNISDLGSTIILSKKDHTDFAFYTRDSWGNQGIIGIKGAVQKFSDLPLNEVPDGFLVKVQSDTTGANPYDGFYLNFVTNSNHQTGTWVETLKDGLDNNFDSYTMPVRIVNTAINDGIPEFTVATCNWKPRRCSDAEANPVPSFIGTTITDVFFYKGRLCFLTFENVIMSKTNSFFDFWRGSATKELDDDPIDVAVSTNKVSNLRYAIPFDKTLLVIGSTQFVMNDSGNLTSTNVSFDPSTTFEVTDNCHPVAAGADVYFVCPNGSYSRLREYFVQPDSLINDAADCTAHVPRYLPKNVYKLESSTANDIIFALSADTPNILYTYKYYWNGSSKDQSAWCRFIFEDDILNMAIINNYLYLVTKNATEIVLVKMNLENIPTDYLPFRVHLDKRVKLTGVFDSNTKYTTWTLPYNDTSNSFIVVDSVRGNQITSKVSHLTSNTVQAFGNYPDPVYIGKLYIGRYRFSEQYFKLNGVTDISGKLMLKYLTLSFTDTGNFKVEFTPLRRETFITDYTATVIGVATIGQPAIQTGEQTFMIMGSNKGSTVDIVSDTYLPFKIQSAQFVCTYDQKARVT